MTYRRTPVVPQMEEQDCGAACLTSILGAHGCHISLHEARRACGVSRDGASAAAVMRAAAQYGVECTGVRLWRPQSPQRDLTALHKLATPCMVLMPGPHFAVFEGIRRGRARINDPSVGPYTSPIETFADSFQGIAIQFRPGVAFRPQGARWPFARAFGRRVRPYLPHLLFPVIAGLLTSAASVLALLLVRVFVNEVLGAGDTSLAPWVLAALAGCGLAATGAAILQQRALARLMTAISVRTSEKFLWRMLRLPGDFFSRRQLGGLVTRVQANDGLAVLFSTGLANTVAATVSATVYLTMMLTVDPGLSLVAIGAAVLDVGTLLLIARRRRVEQHQLQTVQERRDGVAFAGLADIETVKADGAEDWLFARWAGWHARGLNLDQGLAARLQTLLVLPTALTMLATGLNLVIGAMRVLDGSLSLGDMLTMQLLLSGFLAPVGSIVSLTADLLSARGQIAMVDDVLEAEVDRYLTPITSGDHHGKLRGGIELHNVSFGYTINQPPLIEGLSLVLAPGARVAVVGASGSGKSTLARLAAGVLRPWSGEVLIDGRPRDQVARAALTVDIAYVEQDLRLFEGTVRDNLTLWDPTMPECQISAALADAQIAGTIDRRGGLDGGWIREQARNLSGGERQRLEISRALALEPAVLILDEATSALDADTEMLVDQAISARGCTTLIVAHRLSTVRDADHIVVLDRGRVVEEGTHDQLVAARGRYLQLLESES